MDLTSKNVKLTPNITPICYFFKHKSRRWINFSPIYPGDFFILSSKIKLLKNFSCSNLKCCCDEYILCSVDTENILTKDKIMALFNGKFFKGLKMFLSKEKKNKEKVEG